VYFLLDLLNELDLSDVLGPAEARDPLGEKGFDSRRMTMLLSTHTAGYAEAPAAEHAELNSTAETAVAKEERPGTT
jgi:hypothetical protein